MKLKQATRVTLRKFYGCTLSRMELQATNAIIHPLVNSSFVPFFHTTQEQRKVRPRSTRLFQQETESTRASSLSFTRDISRQRSGEQRFWGGVRGRGGGLEDSRGSAVNTLREIPISPFLLASALQRYFASMGLISANPTTLFQAFAKLPYVSRSRTRRISSTLAASIRFWTF